MRGLLTRTHRSPSSSQSKQRPSLEAPSLLTLVKTTYDVGAPLDLTQVNRFNEPAPEASPSTAVDCLSPPWVYAQYTRPNFAR